MSRTTLLGLFCVGALLAALGCGESGEAPGPSKPPAAPTKPAAASEPAPEPPTAAPAVAGTFPCVAGDASAGAAQYDTLCTSCHGPGGSGEGPAAAGLNPKPARHVDGSYMNALSNEHLFTVIRDGGAAAGKSPLMAPWGGALSDAQVWDVVAYVRTLADPPYSCP